MTRDKNIDAILGTMKKTTSGFTIVELLIVIVVIAILATIAMVAYSGIQDRAKNSQVQSDIRQVSNAITLYYADNGSYPSTGSIGNVYSDSNCLYIADDTGLETVNWVPNVEEYMPNLPQNPGLANAGTGNDSGGCYMYASDGVSYILSAWNAKRGDPSTDIMYRRLGFRDPGWMHQNNYLCNHPNIGGMATGTYNALQDIYKLSYTVSNISCNETPPAGA